MSYDERRRIYQAAAARGQERGREFVKELRKAQEKGDEKKIRKLQAEFTARQAISNEPSGIRDAERRIR